MKIIKKGKINNIVTCDFCECEYEFDINDIKKESIASTYTISINANNTHEYKYVECPCCGHKYYLHKLDKIIYKSGEVTLKDGITGIIGDALTTTKVEDNNGK